MANQSATATSAGAATAALDRAFAALADPTRRAVIERLQRGPATVSELAQQHPMSLPSFMKHVAVLTHAGLVTSTKRGRVRECRLERAALDETARWIDERRRVWHTRFDALDSALQKGTPE